MNIIEKINEKMEERAAKIRTLISDVKNTIGETGYEKVNVNGVTYTLKADRETVSTMHWVKSDDLESGGYWSSAMVFDPHEWSYKCSADKSWDGTSTDIETLENLMRLFDAEKAEMDIIQKVLDAHRAAYRSRVDAVAKFFDID